MPGRSTELSFGLGKLHPVVDIGTIYIGIVTVIHIEVVTVLHELVAHSGEEPGIEGYGFFVVTVLKGLVYLEFDGLQQLGDGAAIIVYVPWSEDSVQLKIKI